jgi:hypothetical protein
MTADEARELERRFRAQGLSRKATRKALAEVRAWIAEHPAPPIAPEAGDDAELVAIIAQVLLRDLRRR